jgi:hypothetical protein
MSETAPERPSSSGPGTSSSSQGPPVKRENVFTRKLGPLPMWVWLVIVAAIILLYVVYSSSKKKGSSSSVQQDPQQGGFGRALLPEVILEQLPGPPHQRHRHHRGGHKHRHPHHRPGGVDPGGPVQPGDEAEAVALNADRQKAARDPGPGYHSIPGINRRSMRGKGEPVPGELVTFKTAEQGQTPSLADVANNYNTEPDAIVMESEGRGFPNSVTWKRYVAQHDWSLPLPPATQLQIIAHPQ